MRIATAHAIGIPIPRETKNNRNERSFTALVWPPSRPMLVRSVDTRNTPVNAEIAASHRSCCRSSPVDRWNRWTSPTTAAIDRPARPSPPTQTATSRAPWSAGTPSGFSGWVVAVTSMTPGRNITASASNDEHVISATGNQRHARDGSLARREQQQDQRDRGYDEERPVVHPGDGRPERQRARLGFDFGGLLWIDALHHVDLVADPLLAPFVGIMGIGIMGILHRL